ncbi:MAG: helix-hairpin-helix domain-containing protein [Methylocystis sp.]
MTKPLPKVRDSKGSVALGRLLGRGGEGTVYEIADRSGQVAKLYHQDVSSEKASKIETMASLQNDRLLSLAAWPLDLLRSTDGKPVGLLLPRVDGHKDIHNLYSPRSRKAEFPAADWRFLIRSAANTARAFAAIHETGCVIGDVNHGGVCVSDKATVRLIDCDSFQVSVGARRYLCEVGVPTFTPPELQGKRFRGVVRTPNHDNFGLAILIFHLLFMGRHPFAGRFLGRGDMSIEKAIAEFRFAYGANSSTFQMEPPPNVPPIGIASPAIASLIERAFAQSGVQDGRRPTAKEWVADLDNLEKQTKACRINASHYYVGGLDHCPWCRLEAATGAVLFSFVIKTAPLGGITGRIDVGSVWARIAAIPSPGPAPNLPDWNKTAPSKEAFALGRQRRFRNAAKYAGLIAIIVVLMGAMPAAAFIWIVGGLFVLSGVSKQSGDGSESAKFRDAVARAEGHFKMLKARWDQDASDQRFTTHLRQLQHEKEQLLDLPNLRRHRYQELERARERDQRKRYLEAIQIEPAKIPGIGPGRKAMLASYNIETAWDVSEAHITKVPGFGPALTRELMKWRQVAESGFRFDASKGVDPRDIAALDRDVADMKQKLEQSLINGPQALTKIRDHILAQRIALKPSIEQAGKVLAQAKADLSAI